MSPKSQFRDPFAYGRHRGTFLAWAMSIVFAAVAGVSFTVEQTVNLSSGSEVQIEVNPPSLLHPVQLIRSLIDAASE